LVEDRANSGRIRRKERGGYTPFEQLEGDAVDGAAVIEFPSMELAKDWYNSPAYRAIMHHRQQGARYIGPLDGGRTAASGTTDAAHKDAQTT
jgi:hypothetical protein